VQKQLSLHLPLANILYLLVPLCSLDALSVGRAQECFGVLPLAAFMAWIAAGLYKHRLLGAQSPFAWRYSLAIGMLFGVGYLPLCARAPVPCAAVAVSVVCLTRARIAAEARLPDPERRFVLATIRRALPWFLGYLLLLAFRSVAMQRDLGAQAQALVLLRDVAAFTLLGYLISELHARTHLPAARVLVRAAATGMLIGLAHQTLRDHTESFVHSLESAGLLTTAALAGALIHRAQLRLVRSWGQSWRPAASTASTR
jgi:hypothetical protein